MLVAFWGTPATGQEIQERPNAAEARSAIGQLRSPYCPGFMLETCTSSQAAALRDSIYDLAEQGVPSGQIVEWMIGNHGEEWRAVPMRSGAGLWAWVVPPLVLLAGFAVVVGWWKSSRRAEPAQVAAEQPLITADERERVAHALREWQRSGEEEI